MTARCGSNSIEHRAKHCRTCKKIYNAAYRQGKNFLVHDPAACAFCGLIRGNMLGVPVYRYPLERTIYTPRKRTINLASIGLCDRCLVENTKPSPSYVRATGLTEREWPAVARRAA